jgi:hypothetical protein
MNTIVRSGDCFVVVTPVDAIPPAVSAAPARRFCTWASSMLVPSLNVMVSVITPSLVACENM